MFCLIFHSPCTELKEPLGDARLPLSARFAKSKRHSQPLSAFLVAFALWGHVAGRWHSLLCASGTLHSLFTGQCQLWSFTKKEGLARKSRAVSSGKQRQVADLVRFWCSYSFWLWGSKIDLSTWTSMSHCSLQTHHLFRPMLAERFCVDMYWNAGDGTNGIPLPATALRSPNSGVKLPLLVSPLISYGNDAFRPAPAVLT